MKRRPVRSDRLGGSAESGRLRLFSAFLGSAVLCTMPAWGAQFDVVLAPYDEPLMALFVQGEIVAGDAGRMAATLDLAERDHTDHRLRAIALNSQGGIVGEALHMVELIRSRGLVTVVPEGGQCVSVCVLLFAAGSRKIASTGAFIGVHGASDDTGYQSANALAATTVIAKTYADFGVPASVIGRMVVTPPGEVAWLTAAEIETFPWGAVMPRLALADAPIALSGLDAELRTTEPRRPLPDYQKAGHALPIPDPPSNTFSAPSHSPELIRRSEDFSTGYAYGAAMGATVNCNRMGGDRRRGCLAGAYDRNKFDHAFTSAPKSAFPPLSAAQYAQQWLDGYDYAYTRHSPPSDCGNESDPELDGCRAGAAAWPRTERHL